MAKGVITDVIDLKSVGLQIETTLKGLEQIAVKIDEINAKQGKIKSGGTTGSKSTGGTYDAEKAQALELDRTLQKLKATESQLTTEIIKAKNALSDKQKQQKLEIEATDKSLGAFRNLQAQVKLAEQAYKDLAVAQGLSSKETKQAIDNFNKLNNQLKEVNRSTGNFRDNVGNYSSAFDKIKGAWVGIAAAYTGFMAAGAGVIGVMKSAIKEAMEDEAATKRLTFAMEGNNAAVQRMLRLKEKLMYGTMFSEGDIMGAINMSLELGRTELQTEKMIETAMGLSRVTGVDLNTAMLQLSGTYEGNLGRLSKFDGAIEELTQDQLANGEAVDILHGKLSKLMTEGVDTMEGKVKMMRQWWTETLESIGFGIINVIEGLKAGFTAITALMGGGISEKGLAAQKASNTKAAQLAAHQQKMDQINAEIDNNKRLLGINQSVVSGQAAKVTANTKETESLRDLNEELERQMDAVDRALGEGAYGAISPMTPKGMPNPASGLSSGRKIPQQAGKLSPDGNAIPGANGTEGATELEIEAAKWNAKFQIAAEYTGKISSLVDATYSNRFAKMDQEAQKDEENKEKELAKAGGNKAKIEEINKKYALKEKERDKERRRLEIEQAKFKKASGIVSAVINTALGVTNALTQQPPILGAVLAALAAITGAAEIALIASQPIPSYAKGRNGGKAEFANVGERGVEKITTKDGQEYFTPGTSTLAYLPEGATVTPHHELIEQARRAAFDHSDYSGSLLDYQLFSTNTRIDQTNAKLDLLAEVIKNKKELHLNIDKRGWHTAMKDGNYWTEYVNNNVRL